MNDVLSLSHAVWDCKYHIIWIPKYRRKVLYGELRKNFGEMFRGLARQKESRVLEEEDGDGHKYISILRTGQCGSAVNYIFMPVPYSFGGS